MALTRHFFLLLATSVWLAPAQFAFADPLVIRGIGPNDVQAQPAAADAATYNMPPVPPITSPAPQRLAAAPNSANLGGGFLEFLATGHSAPAAATHDANPPPPATLSARYEEAPQPRRSIDPIYQRQEVEYSGHEKPGTIVIDTPNKFLFLVQPGARALRYGIGVGRPGFTWSGVKTISRKAEWPDWTPPAEMLERRPDLPTHMDGGPANPLGARALYLGSSLYRIHGTNEPYTIGTNVSSGCIRMMNEDVIDLYNRVPVGTKVIIL